MRVVPLPSFLYLSLLYLFLRLAVAASCLPYVYTSEDHYTMNLAIAWSRAQPVLDLVRPSSFIFGGDLFNATLFLPFGLLFGLSYFNLKVFAILEGLAILGMWYALIRRTFGRRPAVLFGLLYILAPHYFVVYTMISYGYHFETGLVQAATCLLFFRMRGIEESEKSGGFRAWRAFAVGAAVGAGLFWSYLFLITLGAVGSVWLFVDARRIGRRSAIAAAGAALLVAAALYWGTGTRIHFYGEEAMGGAGLRPDYLSALWHNLISISDTVDLRQFQVPDLSPGRCDALLGERIGLPHPGNLLYRVLFIFAAIALIPLAAIEKGRKRSFALLILLNISFFFFVYTQISYVRFGAPYRVTLYPFAFAAVALVPSLSRSWLLRVPYGLALSVILGMGFFNAVSSIDPSGLGTPRDFRGLDYYYSDISAIDF